MTSFFKRLSYSFGNEDWRTEHKALNIKSDDRVLCITASGDRPLNLLLADCKEILALDANPIQNHLLCLKKAALKELEYQDYLGFLGVTEVTDRTQLFLKIKNSLSKDSLHYWEKNAQSVLKGVLYEGSLEKKLKIVSQVLQMVRGQKIDKLFSFDDLNKQRDFVNKTWDTKSLRKVFDILLHPYVTKVLIKDPGLYENLEDSFHVGKYIYQKMHHSLERFPAKENIILSLCLQGKVYKESYPPYLMEKESQIIKDRLEKISFKTIDVLKFLETAKDNSFDCFSLSDVASYMDYPSFERLLSAIFRTAKPNARFCIRQFLTHYPIPPSLKEFFQREPSLEEQLEGEDRCFIYRFMVGSVIKK